MRTSSAVSGPPPSKHGRLIWLLPGLILAVTIAGAHAFWIRVESPSLASEAANAFAIFVALLGYAGACLLVRRWLALPVAALGIVALGAVHVYDFYRPVRIFYPGQVEEKVRFARQERLQIERAERDVADWRAGRLPADSMPCAVSGDNVHYAPGLPFGIPIGSSSFDLVRYSGPIGTNRMAWERFGVGLASVLRAKRRDIEERIAAYKNGLAQPTSMPKELALRWVVESVELTLLLLSLNGLMLPLARLFGRRSGLRRSVAAT